MKIENIRKMSAAELTAEEPMDTLMKLDMPAGVDIEIKL